MLGIHRNIRRAALIAAAAVLTGTLSAQSARANTLYGPTSFGSPTFSSGNVNGQAGFGVSVTGSPGTSTATVNTSVPELTVTRNAGDALLAAPTFGAYDPASTFTIDSKVTVLIPTFTGTGGSTGPAFGLDVFGDSGGTNVAGLVVDASNGEIYDSAGGSVFTVSPTVTTSVDTPVNLEVDATFSGGTVTLNYLVNSVSVDTNTASAASFYDAAIFGGEGFTNGGPDVSNVADFTNYSVTESSSVPEPTSLAALCVGGVLFGLRRNRRAVTNI
jgi:hypothetical protein